MARNEHIPIINTLRGIAATVVCFYHFVCTTTGFIKNEHVLSIFKFGQYGVSMFFIISGIVIPLSLINGNYTLKKWGQFMMKRIVRIEPPYIVAIFIGIGYLYIRNFVPGSASVDLTPSVINIILHFGYLIPFFEDQQWINPVFWTLAIEFQYYLIISLLIPLLLKEKMIPRIVGYTILVSGPFIYDSTSLFLVWSPYFLLGIVYALYLKKRIHYLEYITVSIVALSVIIPTLGIIHAVVAVLTLALIYFFSDFSSKAGNFFGNISYSLYLLHSIIGSAFVNFFSHRADSIPEKIIVILSGYMISVIAAYLLYRIVELPSQRYSRKFYS